MSLRGRPSISARAVRGFMSWEITIRGRTAGNILRASSPTCSPMVRASSGTIPGLLCMHRPMYSMTRSWPVTISLTNTPRSLATECSSSAAAARMDGDASPRASTSMTRLIQRVSRRPAPAPSCAMHASTDPCAFSRCASATGASSSLRSSFSSCSSDSLTRAPGDKSSPGWKTHGRASGLASWGMSATAAFLTAAESEHAIETQRRSAVLIRRTSLAGGPALNQSRIAPIIAACT
mmetsp:Transcript_31914/g.75834  ORF Transcript_31914/g.75834 Transcript_31914/m.75834 type:complete len:236 (-) Transcript_31914:190-897(-)